MYTKYLNLKEWICCETEQLFYGHIFDQCYFFVGQMFLSRLFGAINFGSMHVLVRFGSTHVMYIIIPQYFY